MPHGISVGDALWNMLTEDFCTQDDTVSITKINSSIVHEVAEPIQFCPGPAEGDADAGLLAWVLGIGVVVLGGAVAGTWVMRRTP